MHIKNNKVGISVSRKEQLNLRRIFPDLANLWRKEPVDCYYGAAVSVFDHWLSESEYCGLNELATGQQKKYLKQFNEFHYSIADRLECLTFKINGRRNREYINFKKFTDLAKCKRYMTQKSEDVPSAKQFKIVIPERSIVYFEGWDYTNYMYSSSKQKLEEFQQDILETTLNILEL